ncbi:serine-rich adhesin for platelets-like isoform X2 [Vanessa cardui]|uniref:serine-rich adhesin for platelets-like isoform X2 n=1 Tax=Vanessa cardui TaxID=171605 RepID=UPI001F12ABF7|nr:serine-rich adhesin for platelets-like isoform X2 [Vanessa cardui]
MTSEIDVLQTNEFLRRRKLRLQQVREQSKDIAKRIRQRAKVEKSRQITDIDSKKEKEYFECQEKLVKRLELLYSKGLQNVGASHKKALEVCKPDLIEKTDPSKLRGKEAAAEVRKRKQENLDEQKKLLDRKLKAREVANEISREKSTIIAKNITKQTKRTDDPQSKSASSVKEINDKVCDGNVDPKKDNLDVSKADMATQWEFEELPNEWEPNIPALSLPKDETVVDTDKSDKNKRPNLFALSDEMPSSLRGGLSSVPEETVPLKTTLNLVSDYLQNRNLRLRQFEPFRKPTDDLQSIKQTILRTRASRADGNKDKSFRSADPEIAITKKKSISVYNHNTRDIMDVPYGKEEFVSHDKKSDEDAYAQALQETASAIHMEKEQINKRQKDMRNKVAATKQNVDKEYRDTLAFLNSLPKDNGLKPIKTSYMDDQRQQLQKDRNQRKLQLEFKKIEKECQRNCKHNKRKSTVLEKSRSKSKSPVTTDEKQRRDFEYSWMPVPESDGNFAIHTIPTTTRNKSGNTVKFSEPNGYHEYRSRHKHTPPTKDNNNDKHGKKIVETVIVQQNSNGSDDSENSVASETSSVENLSLERDKNVSHLDSKLRDADRIIIYKILDSRNKRSKIKKSDSITNHKNNSNPTESCSEKQTKQKSVNLEQNIHNIHKDVSFDQVQEGVYKGVNSQGIANNYFHCTKYVDVWGTSDRKCWWDNITSLYFSKDREVIENQNSQTDKLDCSHCCGKTISKTNDREVQNEGGDTVLRTTKTNVNCHCEKKSKENSLLIQSSAATSSTSFKTAPHDKANNVNPDSGLIKLIDDGGNEAGKFYIGASGFIKDDNYEVVIQLRKKDGEKVNNQENKNVTVPDAMSEVNNALTTLDNKQVTEDGGNLDLLSNNKEESTGPALSSNVTKYSEAKNKAEASDTIQNVDNQSLSKEKSETAVTETVTKPQISNTCEKAVHTSFEDIYAIPIHVPKIDPISRPATSTYTQTSFNSSIQRPVFMHMSSSTSTAYMSPPELVLPKFLKQDYIMTHEDMFAFENNVNHSDPQYEVIGDDCNVYEECRCKRCVGADKNSACIVNLKKRNANNTPPNTARSNDGSRLASALKKTKKRNCKCHKCKCSSETKLCKSYKKRTKSANTNSTIDNFITNKKVESTRSQKPSVHTKEKGDDKINPVVKTYIKKLLALNREGLKAVEIMNQDCSVASTPGSSIINAPSNKDKQQVFTETVDNKISLEQIKNILKQQILKENLDQSQKSKSTNVKSTECQTEKHPKQSKIVKKKSVHKVKSLNISRQLLNKKKTEFRRPIYDSKIITSTSSSTREERNVVCVDTKKSKPRCRSSPTPRSFRNSDYKNSTSSDIGDPNDKKTFNHFKSVAKNWTQHLNKNNPINNYESINTNSNEEQNKTNRQLNLRTQKLKQSYISSDSENPSVVLKPLTEPQSPVNLSTQTNRSIDVETNFMKIAEDKLQNMEKIADLTEKCTKRLSNLAKVLEEVRRNKSLVYSQISTSDSASESEHKSDKNEFAETSIPYKNVTIQNKETEPSFSSLTIPLNLDEKKLCTKDSAEYIPFLNDIPKPVSFIISSNEYTPSNDKTTHEKNTTTEDGVVKIRGRPPPALSRISLKNGQEICITPHELSTVIEVDSPMSFKLKNQSSRPDTKFEEPDKLNQISDETDNQTKINVTNTSANIKETRIDPDLLQSNLTTTKNQAKVSTDSSDDSKIQTMDINRFNDIMLKPFISLQEYAKQCNIGLEEGSNIEDVINNDPVNEELSSLHSDGSLPDVIAELLKRNIISEPFKFDTGSNGNSTTLSSESTLSILALSKTRKDKKKSGLLLKNKENIADTSETLSISSNPDLENAFQKMGMGWASSTLKKTKERLALSSSSNTSSSSMAQFKIKSFSQVIPTLTTDSTSSLLEISKGHERKKVQSPGRNVKENYKNAIQQTSLTNSMTVKEFLTNELAKKITFSNKISRKEADEEFVSLYETNMPEDMKRTNIEIQEDEAQSTVVSNTRARTSTPVQIFKSTTYNSTSSSTTSNGLFSNADDLSSVKVTSTSMRNHSTSDKDDLTIPNYSLKTRKELSDFSKSD